MFGINSLQLRMHTPNDATADYARAHPKKIIRFMSVDPNQPDALDEIQRCAGELGLREITMSPVYQNYHPCDGKARCVHQLAEQLSLPILTRAAFHSIAHTPMEWASARRHRT